MTISDRDVNREFIYFLMAYYFHWTPELVDSIDNELVESLLTQLPLWVKKINEVKNDTKG